MAAPAVEFKDEESVVEGWKLHNSPFFAVWQGSTLKAAHEEESMENAETLLREMLKYIQASNTTAIYTLKVYKDAPITNKKEYKGSFTFRLYDYDQIQPINGRGEQAPVYVLNGHNNRQNQLPAANTAIDSKLDKLIELQIKQAEMITQLLSPPVDDDDDEDNDDEEETTEQKIEKYTQIGTTIVQHVKPILELILDRFAPIKNSIPNYQNIGNVAAENKDEILTDAVQKITTAIGEDAFIMAMRKLAAMAETNPDKLKSLINML